jgi:hypothetical protein
MMGTMTVGKDGCPSTVDARRGDRHNDRGTGPQAVRRGVHGAGRVPGEPDGPCSRV